MLELIAAGLSNKEIGEQVRISENTVKTHSRRCSTSSAPGARELRQIA